MVRQVPCPAIFSFPLSPPANRLQSMTERPTPLSPRASRWWILGLAHMSALSYALTLQMIPPILGSLVSQMGMSHTQAGALMGLFTLPGVFVAIPGGYLADRLGPRRMGVLSLVLMTAGTLMMLPLTPIMLFSGRFIAGVGATVLVVIAPQIIARRFLGRELGLAMGIFNTAVPLGTIISFNLLSRMGAAWGIWPVIAFTGGATFIVLVIFSLTFSEEDRGTGLAPPSSTGSGLRRLGGTIWLVALVWALFNMSILSFFTFGIDYFRVRGFGPGFAGLLSSLPMIISIFLVPLVGLFMDRLGWRAGLLFWGGIIMGGSIMLIFYDPARALPWTILLGVGISMVPPVIFSMAGEVVPRDLVGLGFGLLTAIFNGGVFLGIPMVGSLKDFTGRYDPGFWLMAGLALCSSVIALFLVRSGAGVEIEE